MPVVMAVSMLCMFFPTTTELTDSMDLEPAEVLQKDAPGRLPMAAD